MKRILVLLVALAVALPMATSCLFEENIDVIVKWGFAPDDHSAISHGPEILIPSAQTLLTAFDNAFYSSYSQFGSSHTAVMRGQTSRSRAIKNISKAADAAVASLPDGFSCPVDGVFVVRMTYGERAEETVWARNFQ